MIFSGPTECSHCHAPRSPLWRRGEKGEVLCNACGLYWRNHGTKRPLNAKRSPSPIQKSEPNLKMVSSSASASLPRSSEYMTRSKLEEVLYQATKLEPSSHYYESREVQQKSLIPLNDMAESMMDHQLALSEEHSAFASRPFSTPAVTKESEELLLSHVPTFCRSSLSKELLKMKDACDPISFVDISFIQSASPASTEDASSASSLPPSSEPPPSTLPGPNALSLQESIGSCYKRKRSPLNYMGQAYHIGDVVLVKGKQQEHYFGTIRQLYVNEYGQKFFSMAWLIPKKESLNRAIDLKMLSFSDFELGSLHQAVESMDCIISILLSSSSTCTLTSSSSASASSTFPSTCTTLSSCCLVETTVVV